MKSILKSRRENEIKSVEFLVFGYSSKMYKDDVKALELDRETHLIPAPYEAKDLISRYFIFLHITILLI